eukprot:jgi/Chlat1/8953/Chrsp94S08330
MDAPAHTLAPPIEDEDGFANTSSMVLAPNGMLVVQSTRTSHYVRVRQKIVNRITNDLSMRGLLNMWRCSELITDSRIVSTKNAGHRDRRREQDTLTYMDKDRRHDQLQQNAGGGRQQDKPPTKECRSAGKRKCEQLSYSAPHSLAVSLCHMAPEAHRCRRICSVSTTHAVSPHACDSTLTARRPVTTSLTRAEPPAALAPQLSSTAQSAVLLQHGLVRDQPVAIAAASSAECSAAKIQRLDDLRQCAAPSCDQQDVSWAPELSAGEEHPEHAAEQALHLRAQQPLLLAEPAAVSPAVWPTPRLSAPWSQDKQ